MVAGQRTTFGSPSLRDNVASAHDPMIERLIDAGAIIHARTTVSEFCVSGVCVSPMWGTTRNPWNLQYSPGGSSGGSAAALASGMTTLATGTDMGGSIRVPASACGQRVAPHANQVALSGGGSEADHGLKIGVLPAQVVVAGEEVLPARRTSTPAIHRQSCVRLGQPTGPNVGRVGAR